jgi:hypothetical protein
VNDVAEETAPPAFSTLITALPAVAIKLAGTVALRAAALRRVVGRAAPFHFTVAPDRNPEPFTVRVKAAPPATAEAGVKVLIMGIGAITVNVCPLESVAAAVSTIETATDVGAVRAVPGMVADSDVEAAKVVGRSDCVPATLIRITSVGVKPKPDTVIGALALPAFADAGLIAVRTGSTYRAEELVDTEPSGFFTVTLNRPEVRARLAGTDAVRAPAFTNVVVKGVPDKLTIEPATNPLPESESGNVTVPAST